MGEGVRSQGHTKRRLRNHPLPPLLLRLLSRLHHPKHLLLTNPLYTWQRHTELRRLLIPLLLNRTTDLLLLAFLLISVQQVPWQGLLGRFCGGGFLGLLLVRPDGLLHLDLLMVPFLCVHLGAQTREILRVLADSVGFARGALADSFIVVEAEDV